MDLATIEVDRDEAEAKLDEYRESLRGNRNREDAAIAAGYRAAKRGLQVISLQRTIGAGGFHDGRHLPRIAVIRATARECFAWWASTGDVVFSDRDDHYANRGALVNAHTVRVTVPGDDRPEMSWWNRRTGHTMVPLIPPRLRPSPRRLRGFHILWEVDEWAMVPPEDPALIRHIGGDLWSVHAVWNLTPLERAVLGGQ